MYEIEGIVTSTTDIYGSTPAVGNFQTCMKWVNDTLLKDLLSFGDQVKKKGEEAVTALERILSVFHRDPKNNPIIGNWMFKRCMVLTGKAIFNAVKNKDHPKQKIIENAIIYVEPMPNINLHNGKLIIKPDGIKTYTVSLANGRSFFKAYEFIKAGATCKLKVGFDDNMISEEHADQILETCGRFGVGAFRERFGKFEFKRI